MARPNKVDPEQFKRLHSKGATDRQLGSAFKITASTVSAWRKTLNLEVNRVPRKTAQYTEPIGFKISARDKARLVKASEVLNKTQYDIIREALDLYLDNIRVIK